MADQASTLARINAAKAEAQAIGIAPPPVPTPTGSVFDDLAPGYARKLGTYVNPDPDWAAAGVSITDYSGLAADPKRHQALLFGGGHGQSHETDIRAFNTLAGAWSSLYPSTKWADMVAANFDPEGRWINTNHPSARHTYNLTCVRDDEFWLLMTYTGTPDPNVPGVTGRLCCYDLASSADPTTRWKFSSIAMPWYYASAAVVDPASKDIYVFGLNGSYYGCIWKFDPVADAWAMGPPTGGNTQPYEAAYCPLDDRFYTFENNGVVRRCTINRSTLSASAAALLTTTGTRPVTSGAFGYPSFAWNPLRKKFGGCFINGKHYEFDPATLVWTATTLLLESGNTVLPSNDFFASDFMEDIRCYVAVQNHPNAGPTTWVIRP